MNAVGIDVSKVKSMIAVMRPGNETVIEPFEAGHTDNELIYNYGNNSIRKRKTDKKDAQKIVKYAIDNWTELPQYFPEEDVRLMLKHCYRQYEHFSKNSDDDEKQPHYTLNFLLSNLQQSSSKAASFCIIGRRSILWDSDPTDRSH